jgi:hypothetical protein
MPRASRAARSPGHEPHRQDASHDAITASALWPRSRLDRPARPGQAPRPGRDFRLNRAAISRQGLEPPAKPSPYAPCLAPPPPFHLVVSSSRWAAAIPLCIETTEAAPPPLPIGKTGAATAAGDLCSWGRLPRASGTYGVACVGATREVWERLQSVIGSEL